MKDCPARLAGLVSLVVGAVCLTACLRADPYHLVEDGTSPETPRVLLMPPDVTVLQVGAGGLPLPRADWTAKVEAALESEGRRVLAEHDAELIRYDSDGDGVTPYREADVPAVHMHQTVLQAVLAHHYAGGGGTGSLPAEARQHWTLGTSVAPLREAYEADYAMFVLYRQATASVGRTLLNTLLMLYGVAQPNSRSVAFASLVNLETGAVVWTNLMRGSTLLDANEPDNLSGRTRKLLEGLPL